MIIDVNNFLVSLAAAIAGAATPAFTLGRDLFPGQSVEAQAADPVVALAIYPGPKPGDQRQVDAIAVQASARGTSQGVTLMALRRVFEALLNDRRVPRTPWTIAAMTVDADAASPTAGQLIADLALPAGWYVGGIDIKNSPGVSGRDPKTGRWLATMNMDVHFGPAG